MLCPIFPTEDLKDSTLVCFRAALRNLAAFGRILWDIGRVETLK